nr:hypothetical protein [uncultured Pseudomonas sp.]
MRALAISLALISTLLQGLIIWYWTQTPAVAQFQAIFNSVYGGTPAWSAAAFAIGAAWLLAPLLTLGILIWAAYRQELRAHAGRIAAASLLLTGALVYAMYPAHLMLRAL